MDCPECSKEMIYDGKYERATPTGSKTERRYYCEECDDTYTTVTKIRLEKI